MEPAEFFSPTSKKLWIAAILFLVLPNFIFFTSRNYGPTSPDYPPNMPNYCGTEWEVAAMGCEHWTETTSAIVPFFGLMWLIMVLFDFSLFFALLPFFILHIIISYAIACVIVYYKVDAMLKLK